MSVYADVAKVRAVILAMVAVRLAAETDTEIWSGK
jgi:hypothetical protein